MALESDVNNADAALYVQFYSRPVKNEFRTQLEGRPIFQDVVYVKIFPPGNPTLIIDTIARQEHKDRFPLHWAHYQNNKAGDEANGTPLSAWTILTGAQVEELKALKFFTVESIALSSDAQLQTLGMVAGMQPHAFRERARRYLEAAKDESYVNQQAETAKKLQAENAELKAQMSELMEMVQELAKNQKKTPGRKPAETAAGDTAPAQRGEADEDEAA